MSWRQQRRSQKGTLALVLKYYTRMWMFSILSQGMLFRQFLHSKGGSPIHGCARLVMCPCLTNQWLSLCLGETGIATARPFEDLLNHLRQTDVVCSWPFDLLPFGLAHFLCMQWRSLDIANQGLLLQAIHYGLWAACCYIWRMFPSF